MEKPEIDTESGGSLLEYGLIIGFTIFAFIIVITIILNIIDWSSNQVEGFFGFFPEG